jgi:hypothetical protein
VARESAKLSEGKNKTAEAEGRPIHIDQAPSEVSAAPSAKSDTVPVQSAEKVRRVMGKFASRL